MSPGSRLCETRTRKYEVWDLSGAQALAITAASEDATGAAVRKGATAVMIRHQNARHTGCRPIDRLGRHFVSCAAGFCEWY